MKIAKYVGVTLILLIAGLLGFRALRNQDPVEKVNQPKTTVAAAPSPQLAQPASKAIAETKAPVAPPDHKNGDVGQLLAALSNVNWSENQIAIIQREFDDAVRLREQAELRVAMREVISPGRVLITIPAFPHDGKAILDRFYTSLAAKLGPNVANNVAGSIGNQIKLLNHDFGAQEQNILFETTDISVHVVQGTSRSIKFDSQEVVVSGASTGNLNPAHLGGYEYLKPLFVQKQ